MRCCRARFVVASLLTVVITDCVDTRQTDWLVVGRTRLGRCTVIAHVHSPSAKLLSCSQHSDQLDVYYKVLHTVSVTTCIIYDITMDIT